MTPIFERKIYRTTRMVNPREPDANPIHLLFLEGESDVPDRNLKVGEIVISSDVITRSLPANSEIEIVLRWDQGQDPKVSAYIPFLDQQISSILTMKNKQLPDLDALETQVAQIRSSPGGAVPQSDARGGRLQEIEARLVDARRGDNAAAHSAAAQIGPLLDSIEAESSEELLTLGVAQLKEVETWSTGIVDRFGTSEDKTALAALIKEANGAARGGGHRAVAIRRDRVVIRTWQVLFKQPGFWARRIRRTCRKSWNQ